MAYISDVMLTIIESPLFTKLWPDYWAEEDRAEFASFIASNPEVGDVIPGSGDCRKIRWEGCRQTGWCQSDIHCPVSK